MHLNTAQSRKFFAAGWLLMIALSTAQAGVSVAPLKQDVTVKPGEETTVYITLVNKRRNPQAKAETIHLSIQDVSVNEKGQLSFSKPGTAADSASPWIKLDETTLTLEPDETRRIPCRIKMPPHASGEYYAAVIATLGNTSRDDKGLLLTYRVASGVFVNVAGRQHPRRANIADAQIIWPEATEEASAAGQPHIEVMIANVGRARFEASGEARLVNDKGRPVVRIPLKSNRPTVFAGDSRRFFAPLAGDIEAGTYSLEIVMDYESGWAKARHRRTVEITEAQAALCQVAEPDAPAAGAKPAAPVARIGDDEPIKLTQRAGAFRVIQVPLHNDSDRPATYRLTVNCDAAQLDPAWLRLLGETLTVAPRGKRMVGLSIALPGTAPAGEYRIRLQAETLNAEPDAATAKHDLVLLIESGR